ncbi:MAG: MotA/TolQ/ExbB proton channel family protein [Candidatus Omnitrophica bacterium]|jgi:biopolymer transport protein ExbB|nr:MotA/TolQ/ExbB proton channel family protein [Candidatus Omnitrophota bacterium]MDD5077641.1 MotA/TolQ/ExbB proton channel family protein [Candidatus Omnitrophota bacterium]
MFDLFLKGGPLMWPILICSLVSVTIILERYYYFYRLRDRVPNIFPRVKMLLKDNREEEAVRLCEQDGGPVARILAISIHIRHKASEEREKLISRAGSKILRQMGKYLRALAVIVNTATLLGLLGTVTGMIKAFMKIQELGGRVDASVLAGGIWEALITTAAGLFVAIPTMLFYHYFESKVDNIAAAMKEAATEFLEG